MNNLRRLSRQLGTEFYKLNSRERLIVMFTIGALALAGIMFVYNSIQEQIEDNQRIALIRKHALDELSPKLGKYEQLKFRLEEMRDSLSKSQLTFEQLTAELDKIIRTSIGSGDYDLKRSGVPLALGDEFERQEFTLNIHKLTLDQLTTLLYKLEKDNGAITVGKVDVRKVGRRDKLRSTFEIFSIRRKVI